MMVRGADPTTRITMNRTFSLVLVLLLASMMTVPASAQNREHQQMTADVRMLQEQTQQLAITLAALNQALAESVKALNARLDQANDATRKGFADPKLTIEDRKSTRLNSSH